MRSAPLPSLPPTSRRAILQVCRIALILVALPSATGYQRSYTACSGTQVIDSIGECNTAITAINAAGGSSATVVSLTSDTTWPQGCFYHNNQAYWQASSTGGSTPSPDDNGNAHICRSGYAAGQTSCSSGTAITSFAACMEASEVVAYTWNTYERTSTQCATGSTALVSDAECSSAAGSTWAPQSYAAAVGTEWPQGCFVHANSIYSQAQLRQSTGQMNPTASDGGNVYLCRSEFDPGYEWPQGCFVHNGKTWYSAVAGYNTPDGGMVCSLSADAPPPGGGSAPPSMMPTSAGLPPAITPPSPSPSPISLQWPIPMPAPPPVPPAPTPTLNEGVCMGTVTVNTDGCSTQTDSGMCSTMMPGCYWEESSSECADIPSCGVVPVASCEYIPGCSIGKGDGGGSAPPSMMPTTPPPESGGGQPVVGCHLCTNPTHNCRCSAQKGALGLCGPAPYCFDAATTSTNGRTAFEQCAALGDIWCSDGYISTTPSPPRPPVSAPFMNQATGGLVISAITTAFGLAQYALSSG